MMMAKSMVMMAVLSAACFAHAKKGDVEVKTFTEKTGNTVILEVGDCQSASGLDGNTGNMTVSVSLPYVVCAEVRSYEADVTDKGWFSKDEKSAPRNEQIGVVTTIETFRKDNSTDIALRNLNNQLNNQGTTNSGDFLGNMASTAMDVSRLSQECKLKKESLLMKARQNSPALLAACGK
ncbi:hypothetical protein D3C87_1323950 [compost metagenome]